MERAWRTPLDRWLQLQRLRTAVRAIMARGCNAMAAPSSRYRRGKRAIKARFLHAAFRLVLSVKVNDLEFAPTSDSNDHPDRLSLYVADYGGDQVNDGRLFEFNIGDLFWV
jgi:hypothetical protein